MKKIYTTIFLLFMLPAYVFADLTSIKFMKKAFYKDVIVNWQKAKGVLTIDARSGKKVKYQIFKRPAEKAPLIREFWVYRGSGVNFDTPEGMAKSIVEKEKYLNQLPLFVSGYGWGDEVPGYLINIPVLDVKNNWALICSNWTCDLTGWIKSSKPIILFDEYKNSNSGFTMVNYAFAEKAPIYSAKVEKPIAATTELIIQYEKNSYAHSKEFFIKPIRIKNKLNNRIYFDWWYNQESEFFLVNDKKVIIIRWIEYKAVD